MINIKPLTEFIGAEISGLDLCKPLSADKIQEIMFSIHQHQLLVFRTDGLSELDVLNFCSYFGNLSQSIDAKSRHPQYPELKILKNVGDYKVIAAPAYAWHQDAFNMATPCRFTLMYAVQAPPDCGNTVFISTRYAYKTLPDRLKNKIENLRIIYKSIFLNTAPHSHPFVRVDEMNQCKSLYVNNARALGIVGMENQAAFSLINEVFEHVVHAHKPYAHYYQPGDLLMWDNYAMIHAATDVLPPEKVRILYRIYISGETVAAEEAGVQNAVNF